MNKDVVIVGGGLAAACLVNELVVNLKNSPKKIKVISPDFGNTTPGAAILNPFTGRRLYWNDQEQEAFPVAVDFFSRTDFSPFVKKLDVKRILKPTDYIDNRGIVGFSVERLDSSNQLITYSPGFSVRLGFLVSYLFEQLFALGVTKINQKVVEIHSSLNQCNLTLDSGAVVDCGLAVFAVGAETGPLLKLTRASSNLGTILIGHDGAKKSSLLGNILINRGHIAPLTEHSNENNSLVVGSTYSHDESVCMDQEFEKLSSVLSLNQIPLPENYNLWTGRRSTVPFDKRPIAGFLNNQILVFSGLASKGMFWAPWMAEQIGKIINGISSSSLKSFDPRRF